MSKRKRKIWIAILTIILVFNVTLMVTNNVTSSILHYISTLFGTFALGLYIGDNEECIN